MKDGYLLHYPKYPEGGIKIFRLTFKELGQEVPRVSPAVLPGYKRIQ